MAGAVQEKPTEFRRIDSMESSVAKPPANEANLVTEPIAQAIVARLAARPIEPDAHATIRDRMWQALREGKPLFLGQVHALLGEFGYDLETLHGSLEPTRPPELVSNPNLVTEEIAQAIISRLSARSIAPEALSAVRDGMWQAIREGKPLALEQVHELLAQFGYNPQTLHERPESAH